MVMLPSSASAKEKCHHLSLPLHVFQNSGVVAGSSRFRKQREREKVIGLPAAK